MFKRFIESLLEGIEEKPLVPVSLWGWSSFLIFFAMLASAPSLAHVQLAAAFILSLMFGAGLTLVCIFVIAATRAVRAVSI